MAHSLDIRARARELRRREHLSIDRISLRLGVSRSTIYNWVGDIPIPGSGSGGGFSDEARRRGTQAMKEGRRRLRESNYLFGLESYAALSLQPSFRDFLVSYLAVGKKSDAREVSFSHPDPLMMQMAVSWLRAYGRNRLRFRLQLPPGADADRARRFWAERMAVAVDQILLEGRQVDRPSASSPARGNLLGTLRVASTDTLLRVELQAWIDSARAEWREAAQNAQKASPGTKPV